ncbi:MAG: toll/interleukin-1 receptor domain-containing protein [Proteobacteria bacterium]|nr:toll/interleukin-1 receptor domain-containing protein [Pseudomonadota bacterium]
MTTHSCDFPQSDTGGLPYAFVSYARVNSDAVLQDLRFLADLGVRLWYDRGIAPGTIWDVELDQKIRSSAVVLFYLTEASAQSDYVATELAIATDSKIPVLPVDLEQVSLSGTPLAWLDSVQRIRRYEISPQQLQHELERVALISVHLKEERLIDSLVEQIHSLLTLVPLSDNNSFSFGCVELKLIEPAGVYEATISSSFTPGEAWDLSNRGWRIVSIDGPATRMFNTGIRECLHSAIQVNTLLQGYANETARWSTARRMLLDARRFSET